MKTMTTLITMLLFLQLTSGCKKEPTIEPCSNTSEPKMKVNENFTEIWDIKNKNGFTCHATVVTTNEVIYWSLFHGPGLNYSMVAFDKITGDTLWHRPTSSSTDNHKLIGNYIYMDMAERLICIDPSNGNEVWRFSPAYLSDYLFANGSIYAFFDQGNSADSSALYKINPLSGSAIHIHSIYTNDRGGYCQSPRGIAYWKHPNGNEIIFAQSSALKVSVGRGEYYAIDITGDSMYWDLGEYFSGSAGIGNKPMIDGNNVIICNPPGVASLNLVTKTTNWKITEPISSQTGGEYAILKNGKIFKEAGNVGHFNIIDINNGNQLKTHTGIGTTFYGSPLQEYNNKIYFTTSEVICIVDAVSGELVQKILYNEQIGDNLGGYPRSGLDVDPSNGYIYTTRGFSFVCIKEK